MVVVVFATVAVVAFAAVVVVAVVVGVAFFAGSGIRTENRPFDATKICLTSFLVLTTLTL